MPIPKKVSDGLQYIIYGVENNKNILMQNCDKINNLRTYIVPKLSLLDFGNSETLPFEKSVLSSICVQYYLAACAICEFRMRSLISSDKLRMRYIQEEDSDRQAQSSAGENWLKIVDVISQGGSDISKVSRQSKRKSARKRHSHISNGSIDSNHDSLKGDCNNPSHSKKSQSSVQEVRSSKPSKRNATRAYRRSSRLSITNKKRSKKSVYNQSSEEEVLKISRISNLNHTSAMSKTNSLHGSTEIPESDNADIENILNHNDMLEVHENEILQLNFNYTCSINTRNNTYLNSPTSRGSNGSYKSSRNTHRRSAAYEEKDFFPKMPESHPPLLEVLYTTPIASALQTESGGLFDLQNDKITIAAHRKPVTALKRIVCPYCRKYFYNRLLLNKHVVSHIHDKRRAMKEYREQKAADKTHVCNICHNTFRSDYMLVKHERSHKKYVCEVCNAEYVNAMDFTWHVAKCTGASRSTDIHDTGPQTRSRSRLSSTPGPSIISDKIDTDINDNVSAIDSERSIGSLERANQLSQMSRNELEKWLQESENVKPFRQHNKKRKSRKKSVSSKERELKTDECDKEIADLNLSEEVTACSSFSGRHSMSSTSSSRAITPYSQISSNNMDNWDKIGSEFEDFGEADSMCSDFTAASVGDLSEIEEYFDLNASDNRRESILSNISTLSMRPRTRNVTKAINQLTSKLKSGFDSSTDLDSNTSRTSRRKQSTTQKKSVTSQSDPGTSHMRSTINQKRLSSSKGRKAESRSTPKKRSTKQGGFKMNRLIRSMKSRRNEGFSAVIYECAEMECYTSFPTIDKLMEHEMKKHRCLKLFTCKECKMKFTRQKYLNFHLNTHDPILHLCTFCDNNVYYADDLEAHYELVQRTAAPCREEKCQKRFVQPVDFTAMRPSFLERHVTYEEEKAFVRRCMKQRAIEEGLDYIKKKMRRQRTRRGSTESSIDLETKKTFMRLLKDMRKQGTYVNLTKMSAVSYSEDHGEPYFTPKIVPDNYHIQDSEDDVFNNIMIDDSNIYHLNIIKTPSEATSCNEVTSSVGDTTESETEHISTKSSPGRRRKKLKINLSARHTRSKQVVTLRYCERDLSQYTLPCYADIMNMEPESSDFVYLDDRPRPWRVFL